MKNDPILAALEKLNDADAAGLAKGLAAKSNLVAAKAAKIAGERLLSELIPQLSAAFLRFLVKDDKGCAALMAIARTLVTLDCDDADLYRKGVRHVQMEGSFGPPVDAASELRAICAMGLANTRDPNKTRDLVNLLSDPEWLARGGAARALVTVGSDAAAMVLRFKALTGDKEPDVMCDCLRASLALEGADALPLVDRYLQSRDHAFRDAAILALGESRRDDALEILKGLYGRTVDRELKETILLAIRAGRTEEGMKFVTFIASGSLPE
jgi:HEAT repeat protein